MKSTIKIDFAPNRKSIIKIIRPQEVLDLEIYPNGDYDVRDKHINDFLKGQLNCEPYSLFQIGRNGMLEQAPYDVTTIIPVEHKDEFDLFKHKILINVIPHEDLIKINSGEAVTLENETSLLNSARKQERIDISVEKYRKINEFFNWLDETGCCEWKDRQPVLI